MAQQPSRRRRRVAIGNNKGGTGKTAATVNLAASLAARGLGVLVVDMDPQANATRRLAVKLTSDMPGISEAIKANADGVAADVFTPCGWDGSLGERIQVAPARFELENRISEAGTLGAVERLRRALDGADEDFDVVLIDCPPSLGHLTILALAAADVALCTIEPEYDAVEGAVRYRDLIDTHRGQFGNPDLELAGVIVGRVRAGVGAHTFQLEGLPELFDEKLIWRPYIPERAAIKDAMDAAVPLRALNTAPANAMAGLYDDLGARLVDALGGSR
ncbi:hypothetical protein LI90_4324 [Carbonactinospora thermoautotrophica]|uniref:AAA domain-containing protein n=1 Tax=Carbonactinospora thermoautotrophica TaxID=1469144 RepID=A0A132MZ71_9ACTN|nr:ParA family protein [Carbonactinospora thermoautotrophica]KWX03198.1 hypothetical protein LI90_4249 [Carbonactinospora thermoautotrophica]KWX03273.1 hypothetical protein LI90_4324 [Carbonactinospora thermoautotrophica]